VTTVLATASVVPLLSQPSLHSGLVSQLVLGEAAGVMREDGEFLQVRTLLDDETGWIHRGYVFAVDAIHRDHWLANAGWSMGAVLEHDGVALRAPHRSRLLLEGDDRVRLPGGGTARVILGRIRPYGEVIADALTTDPASWAWRECAGTPYLHGGTTAAGIDAPALVQMAFLARGVPMPRSAARQATVGTETTPDDLRSGDLLSFRGGEGSAVVHVALWLGDGELVHSSVACGGVARERWTKAIGGQANRDRLATVRRLT
jgi:hypothetical protein